MTRPVIQFVKEIIKNINYTLCTFKYTCKDCIGSHCCKDIKICKDFRKMQ